MAKPERALPRLRIAVVGHTNTGKTSLMRTLTRNAGFGEVSDRPATTRHVEGAALLVQGTPRIELFDTPGLEDSIGLLEYLDGLRTDRRQDWIEVIGTFLDGPGAVSRFEQEAKAIRQVLASDAALYVIDAREPVHGKHCDELEILARCARPVVPVLNFVAGPEARTAEWREHLSRLALHAVAAFDTVVLNETGEQRLFDTMIALLEPFRPTLQALIEDRRAERVALIAGAAGIVAELLIDAAAHVVSIAAGGDREAAMEALRAQVRQREQDSVTALLGLFRFQPGDYEGEAVPVANGHWGVDLFNRELIRQVGISVGGGAAAGAATGLMVDLMVGGLSLGAAAALGAVIGATWSGIEGHGRRVFDLVCGRAELRVDDVTLRLLAVRQLELSQALLRRGHAAQERIRMTAADESARQGWVSAALPEALTRARAHPEWSRLDRSGKGREREGNGGRAEAHAALAGHLAAVLQGDAGASVSERD